ELLPALPLLVAAADQIPFDQEHLFPVFMHERHGRVGAGINAKDAGPVAHLVLLIERTGEDALAEPRRISRHVVEALLELEGGEFHVTLVEAHFSLPASHANRFDRSSCLPGNA